MTTRSLLSRAPVVQEILEPCIERDPKERLRDVGKLRYHRNPPGDVQAFDVRTGERAWSFHTIPQKGELGNETWEDECSSYTGSTNVWGPFSIDAERGLVYLPVGAPNNDFYGGHRKGDNLYAESIVCLDASSSRSRSRRSDSSIGATIDRRPQIPGSVQAKGARQREDSFRYFELEPIEVDALVPHLEGDLRRGMFRTDERRIDLSNPGSVRKPPALERESTLAPQVPRLRPKTFRIQPQRPPSDSFHLE